MRRVYLTCLTVVTVVCIILGSFIHLGGGSGDEEYVIDPAMDPMPEDFADGDFAGEVGELVISLHTGSVNVVPGDNFAVSGSNMDGIDWHMEADTLFVTGSTDGVDNSNPTEVTLTLPEYMSLRNADIELSLGNLSLEGVYAESANINCNEGNVVVRNSWLGNAQLAVNTGNAFLENVEFNFLEARCDLGNTDILTTTAPSDYDMELTASHGDIFVAGELVSHNGRYTQRADTGFILRVESETGNIAVQ